MNYQSFKITLSRGREGEGGKYFCNLINVLMEIRKHAHLLSLFQLVLSKIIGY